MFEIVIAKKMVSNSEFSWLANTKGKLTVFFSPGHILAFSLKTQMIELIY